MGHKKCLSRYPVTLMCVWFLVVVFFFPILCTALEKPILIIETGGHQGKISGIAFIQDSRFLVSTSLDKTIRVWDVQSGELVRTIRGQIGNGLEGSLYGLTLSNAGSLFPEC